MHIIDKYRELGSYRAAPMACGVDHHTIARVVARAERGELVRPRHPRRRERNVDAVRALVERRVSEPRGGSPPSGCCQRSARTATSGRTATCAGWSPKPRRSGAARGGCSARGGPARGVPRDRLRRLAGLAPVMRGVGVVAGAVRARHPRPAAADDPGAAGGVLRDRRRGVRGGPGPTGSRVCAFRFAEGLAEGSADPAAPTLRSGWPPCRTSTRPRSGPPRNAPLPDSRRPWLQAATRCPPRHSSGCSGSLASEVRYALQARGGETLSIVSSSKSGTAARAASRMNSIAVACSDLSMSINAVQRAGSYRVNIERAYKTTNQTMRGCMAES